MSVSIVNGYVCTSCSDVAKAKRGEDPADSRGQAGAADKRVDRTPSADPAVIFGGSLAASGLQSGPPAPETGRRFDVRA